MAASVASAFFAGMMIETRVIAWAASMSAKYRQEGRVLPRSVPASCGGAPWPSAEQLRVKPMTIAPAK